MPGVARLIHEEGPTGVGPVTVQIPRDRLGTGPGPTGRHVRRDRRASRRGVRDDRTRLEEFGSVFGRPAPPSGDYRFVVPGGLVGTGTADGSRGLGVLVSKGRTGRALPRWAVTDGRTSRSGLPVTRVGVVV